MERHIAVIIIKVRGILTKALKAKTICCSIKRVDVCFMSEKKRETSERLNFEG